MRRLLVSFTAAAIALSLAGCSEEAPVAMPDVVGKRLDIAISDIERAGFTNEVEVLGGGLLGILDESNWTVCSQDPASGTPISAAPRVTVERSCEADAPEPSASETGALEEDMETTSEPESEEEPTSTPTTPTPEAAVTDVTVDELVDRINSSDMGGMRVGDRVRVTGELVGAEFWTTGASGDFFVNLATASGSDLIVFVDESEADAWRNGTIVEMVLEHVERTINGETTDGWFEAVSTVPVSD